jgi:hypothetical protein
MAGVRWSQWKRRALACAQSCPLRTDGGRRQQNESLMVNIKAVSINDIVGRCRDEISLFTHRTKHPERAWRPLIEARKPIGDFELDGQRRSACYFAFIFFDRRSY